MPDQDIKEKLDGLRRKLIDLSLRNRLLNFRDSSARAVQIVDELPDPVFDILVDQGRSMRLLPQSDHDNEARPQNVSTNPSEAPEPPRDPELASVLEVNEAATEYVAVEEHVRDAVEGALAGAIVQLRDLANAEKKEAEAEKQDIVEELPEPHEQRDQHLDTLLQTNLSREKLGGHLARIKSEYENTIASTGSNLFFMAIGFLRWFDSSSDPDKPRLAPLLLVPLSLGRDMVMTEVDDGEDSGPRAVREFAYFVNYSGEDITHNITLAQKLKDPPYNVELPAWGDERYDEPEKYFQTIREMLRGWRPPGQNPWRVVRQIRLGFFTFGKDIMYRDLDPELWPGGSILESENIRTLLEGKEKGEQRDILPEEVERVQGEGSVPSVLDADSSQLRVLIRAIDGSSFVVQGPPGTGKSQTITNLIAAFLATGKRVLFMAEKLAALEVVKERLEKVNLGAYCLELHSKGASVAQVHSQIRRRLEYRPDLRANETQHLQRELARINQHRSSLTAYAKLAGSHVDGLNLTLQELIGRAEASRGEAEREVRDINSGFKYLDLPPLTRGELPTQGVDMKIRAALESIKTHWAEKVHERGIAWKGYITKNLTQEDVNAIGNILGAGRATLISFLTERGKYPEIPIVSTAKPRVIDSLKDNLPSPPPAAISQKMLKQIASQPGRKQDYQKYIQATSFLTGVKSTRGEALGKDARIRLDAIQAALVSLELLLKEPNQASKVLQETDREIASLRVAMERLQDRTRRIEELRESIPGLPESQSLAEQARAVLAADRLLSEDERTIDGLEESHLDERARIYFDEARAKHEEQEESREKLSQAYSLEDVPPSEVLDSLRRDLRDASTAWYRWWPFGRLAQAQKDARRFAKRPKEVLGAEFIAGLSELKQLPADESSFEHDEYYKKYLGGQFKGRKTDWTRLRQCMLLAEEIRKWSKNEESARGLLQSVKQIEEKRSSLRVLIGKIEGDERVLKELIRDGRELDLAEWWTSSIDLVLDLVEKRIGYLSGAADSIRKLNGYSDGPYSSVYSVARNGYAYRRAAALRRALLDEAEFLESTYCDLSTVAISALKQTLGWYEEVRDRDGLPVELKNWLLHDASAHRFTILSEWLKTLVSLHKEMCEKLDGLSRFGYVEQESALSTTDGDKKPEELLAGLEHAQVSTDVLIRWSDYQRALQALASLQAQDFLAYCEELEIPGESLEALARAAFYKQWLSSVAKDERRIWEFDRIAHEVGKAEFLKRDSGIGDKYRRFVEEQVWIGREGLPAGIAHGLAGQLTEMGLIDRELAKVRKFVPVRELVRRSPNSLRQLMPCWLMGPSSVAQFLPPGQIEFDVLIMDEASQIRPEDAVGSLARSRQVIVVGDINQMPPSLVFRAGSADGDDDSSAVANLESILDVFRDRYHSESLLWHYRSQHEKLILFSSDRYYDKKLIIPPSVHYDSPTLGLRRHFVPEASFHEGINEREAIAVAEFLVTHIIDQSGRPRSQQESIGIVAMNAKQQALIQELYDQALLRDESLREAVDRFVPSDPIFVKNLENVQGDERDVIGISFTYGPDQASRQVYQRFGPISQAGGWRRLNVLFTRARRRIHAFTSMTSDAVRPSRDEHQQGAADLKAYLKYLEDGKLPDFGIATGRGPDSAFEEAVARIVSDLGYAPHLQVGVAGFRVDIGVVDPAQPGIYLGGIECDGASYHSDPVTRDRDRLRESILAERGWRLHRIWSTDWFRNRTTEIERLAEVLKTWRTTGRKN